MKFDKSTCEEEFFLMWKSIKIAIIFCDIGKKITFDDIEGVPRAVDNKP